jgi:hypothetical protein
MYRYIDNAIQLASYVALIAVIGLLFYRRMWRSLPVFTVYCILDLLINLVRTGIKYFTPGVTLHALLIGQVLFSVLVFCVLVELAWSVLRPLRASLPRSAFLLVGVLILVAGAIIWPFAGLENLAHATSREGLIYAQLVQTTSILRILLFLVLAGGSQLLSIGWRDRELQVATGLGMYSIVALAVAVIQTHQTTVSAYHHLFIAVGAGYLGCLLYWAFSFAQQEAERREFTPQMQRFLLAVAGAARATRIGLEQSHGGKPRNQGSR